MALLTRIYGLSVGNRPSGTDLRRVGQAIGESEEVSDADGVVRKVLARRAVGTVRY